MAIIKLPYNHVVVHDIRRVFSEYPKMTSCPMCGAVLQVCNDCASGMSGYAEAVARNCCKPYEQAGTFLCDACGWFALREYVEDLECSAGTDCLLAGVLWVFDPWAKGEHSPCLRRCLDEGGRKLQRATADEVGESMELALRPRGSPCRVVPVAWREAAPGERDDIYLVSDVSDEPWLLQVTRSETEECPRFDPVWLLNGILFTEGRPSHMLVTIENLQIDPPGEDARTNATPPYAARIGNAEPLMNALARAQPAAPADLMERARRSDTIWKEWVPLPEAFFGESHDLRRPTEGPRRARSQRERILH
jgi:hypothetical protein